MGETRLITTKEDDTSTIDGEDRLSSLPYAIIAEILSLLPTKTAISTSVLSRRWHSLSLQLSLLSFTGPCLPSYQDFKNPTPHFLSHLDALLTTVDNVLSRLTSPKIVKFELIIDFPENPDSNRCNSLVDSWVPRVCSRHPEHIAIIHHCWNFGKPFLNIPACIFHCDSLVSLRLGDALVYDSSISGEASIINNNISLPNLKKLEMWANDSHRKLLGSLLKGCPVLEELCLRTRFIDDGHVVEVCFPNLKSLSLGNGGIIATVRFIIDAPRLENLSISCFSAWYRFVNRPSGLLKAKITMGEEYIPKENYFAQLFGLLEGVSRVRVLNVNCLTLRDMERIKGEGLLIFQNLTELKVKEFFFARLDQLLLFLSCSPNLEVLILKMDIQHYALDDMEEWVAPDIDPACLSTKLKVLELKTIDGTNYHLDFMEYVLRNGSVLEKLLVGVRSLVADALRNEFEFCHKLFSCPRNSSVCEIKFCGCCITASSKGFENGVLNCQIHPRKC